MKVTKDAASAAPSLATVSRDLAALRAQVDQLSIQLRDIAVMGDDIRRLVGPFAVPMPGERMLVQTIHGLKYLIDPHDLIMAPQLIVYRQWEAELSTLFRRLLGPDSVVVDVGANFGYFTCLAGASIGASGKGRVLAVEPNPALVELLRANVAINWSMCPVEIFPVAAGASAGEVELSIPLDRAANASLTALEGADVTRVKTDLLRIDDLVPPGLVVDLMKIDVEGHEAGVFEGARRVIAESPDIHIVMEWSQPQMADAGASAQDMIALLGDMGLTAFSIPDDGLPEDARPLPAKQLLSIPYTNVMLRRR